MLRRILMNPDATAGGAGDPASQQAAAGTQAQAAQQATQQAQAATPPTVISLTPEEFTRLREAENKLREIEQENARKLAEAEQAKLLALAESGKAKEALDTLSTKATAELTQLRQQLDATTLDREITLATFGAAWANQEAGADAVAKLRGEFEVVDAGGQRVVRHRQTGKPPGEAIPERLKTSAYAHYLRATATGGTGQASADRTQAATEQAEKPKDLGTAMLLWTKKQETEAPKVAGINLHRIPSFNQSSN